MVPPESAVPGLKSFFSQYPSFGEWSEKWLGIPLENRACLSDELPPRQSIGSVRAVVLRGDEVLLVHSGVPILSIGGRCEPGETLEEALLRECGEESGWLVSPLAVIGFVHHRHLDEQRPAWARPSPDFVDPIFAVNAIEYDVRLLSPSELDCEFVPVGDVGRLGVGEIDRTFLREALRKRVQLCG